MQSHMEVYQSVQKVHTVNLADAVGFEPTVPLGTPVFKTGAISQLGHASMVPQAGLEPATHGLGNRRSVL